MLSFHQIWDGSPFSSGTGCRHCLCPACPDRSKVGGWPEEQHAGSATEGLALWNNERKVLVILNRFCFNIKINDRWNEMHKYMYMYVCNVI